MIDPPLYLVTDRHASPRLLAEIVEECLAAGLRAVQLREKDLGAGELFAAATALRESTRRHGAKLMVNDRADVALAVGADGVQRTYQSLPTAALRRIGPPGFLIGASVHSLVQAREAVDEGADFVVFGPIYDTPSKRQYGAPQGLRALEQVTSASARPVIAVGGITPERVAEVRGAGAAGIAVISAIYAAASPGDRTRAFLDALSRT